MASVIYIDNDGNLSGLADDVWDKLNTLGRKTVERVSNIEFDHTQQCWVATDMEGSVIASNPIRSVVVDLEREFLNRIIEQKFSDRAT
jgi:hypothetical protein